MLVENLILLSIGCNIALFFSQSIMFVYIYRMLFDIKKLLGEKDCSEKAL